MGRIRKVEWVAGVPAWKRTGIDIGSKEGSRDQDLSKDYSKGRAYGS